MRIFGIAIVVIGMGLYGQKSMIAELENRVDDLEVLDRRPEHDHYE